MLCQFSFRNFKSYRDETTIDFRAMPSSEFEDSLLHSERADPLLPVSVIYGPNGGGKSNLLGALACLITTVVNPIRTLEKSRCPMVVQQGVRCEPFLFSTTSKEPTDFQIYFRTKVYEYRYVLSIFCDEIVSESLDRKQIGGKRPAHIFSRKKNFISLGASIAKKNLNTDVNTKMPYLSFLAINYSLPVISDVQEWFESCVIMDYANPLTDSRIPVFGDRGEMRLKSWTIQCLNDVGIGIDDYRIDKEKEELLLRRRLHGEDYEIPFRSESGGTRKLLAVLPLILMSLWEGRLVVIDELDAKLHPKLLRYIISMFKNPKLNTKGAQLLFTSHDVSTMRNSVFRRDEIWFAADDDDHASEIYSLYEIRQEDNQRVKNTAAFGKQYLEGRYGADPYLQNMMGDGWK